MRLVQQLTSNLHPKLIIGTILACVAVWSVILYFDIDSKFAFFASKEKIVIINTPSPSVSNHSSYRAPRMAPTSLIRHHAVTATSTPMPRATMSSTSMHIHQTSDARVQSIGSGGGGGGVLAMTSHSHSSRSVSASSSYTGSFYNIPMVDHAITEVGATNANDMASTTTRAAAPEKAKRGFPDDDDDPFKDPVPVGDVAWGMMAMLAIAYAYIIYRKRTRA